MLSHSLGPRQAKVSCTVIFAIGRGWRRVSCTCSSMRSHAAITDVNNRAGRIATLYPMAWASSRPICGVIPRRSAWRSGGGSAPLGGSKALPGGRGRSAASLRSSAAVTAGGSAVRTASATSQLCCAFAGSRGRWRAIPVVPTYSRPSDNTFQCPLSELPNEALVCRLDEHVVGP